MGIVDALKASGFKPEASTDGEYKPLKGTYKAQIVALRPEIDRKNNNAKYYQFNLKPIEVIEGDGFGERTEFRKRYYVDGDKAAENLKELLNALFTAGIELDTSSDEAMEADFGKAINQVAFIRTWGWTPEGKENAVQMFTFVKEKVAEKRRKTESLPF